MPHAGKGEEQQRGRGCVAQGMVATGGHTYRLPAPCPSTPSDECNAPAGACTQTNTSTHPSYGVPLPPSTASHLPPAPSPPGTPSPLSQYRTWRYRTNLCEVFFTQAFLTDSL